MRFALRVRASIDSRPHVPDFCHRGSTFRLFGISSEFRIPDAVRWYRISGCFGLRKGSANSHAH